MVNVKIKRLYADAHLPQFKTNGSAGGDLTAYIEDGQPIVIKPKTTALIKTGIAVELPKNIEMQVRARSGLALNHNIMLTNGVGTVDTDYRGEVGVMLYNGGSKAFTVNHGDRIAQAVFARYEQPVFSVTETLSETERGEGGYGSTGVKND